MTFFQILNQNHQTVQISYHTIFLCVVVGLMVIGIIGLLRVISIKNIEIKSLNTLHTIEMTTVRKEHCEALEKMRLEMLKREEEKSRQWIESEKETLHILGGVSTLLDLSDKFGRIESEKIITILEEIQECINKIIKAEET